MQVKLLIKALETLPSDAIVQISSCQHEYGSEDISYIEVEDENNNKGNFNFQSATDFALLLRSGALPAPLNVIEERTVGPDLGEDSIKAGAISLCIGFLLVIAYMLIRYRFLGIIADLALIINLILLFLVIIINLLFKLSDMNTNH